MHFAFMNNIVKSDKIVDFCVLNFYIYIIFIFMIWIY